MARLYSNIPLQDTVTKSQTSEFINNFYKSVIDLNNAEIVALSGFFEKRGFAKSSSDSIAVILATQCKKDNINPMNILDTLTGLDNVEISELVAEILNYNRFKSSSLGFVTVQDPASEVKRNIIP